MSSLTRSKAIPPQTVVVVVASGAISGQDTIGIFGEVTDIAVIPPAANTGYDFQVLDADGYPRHGKTGNVGMTNFAIGKMFHGVYTIQIGNATGTGNFSTRIWTK